MVKGSYLINSEALTKGGKVADNNYVLCIKFNAVHKVQRCAQNLTLSEDTYEQVVSVNCFNKSLNQFTIIDLNGYQNAV